MAIRINMLSKADSVPGQGVGSAYNEQTKLVKEIPELEISINAKGDDFDIFHVHSPNPEFKQRLNKKHINVMHVHFIPRQNQGSLKIPFGLNSLFIKYAEGLYRKADELIVVNPYFISSLETIGIPRDNITYIPNYVDSSNFHRLSLNEIDAIKERYNIEKNKFVVLGCGQIQTRKGFDDFVEVAKNNPDMFFIWAGGFSFKWITDGYRKYKKMLKHLPNNMIATGIVNREEMNNLFNIANVFFMPSFLELFPMSILEACALGVPVLLRDLDLYKPILFDNYASGKNVDEFSKELNKLKQDKDYYENHVKYSLKIKDYYSKEKLLSLWKEYYQRIYNKYKTKEKKR